MDLQYHLHELRKRLIHYFLMLLALFVVCFYFSNELFLIVARPLITLLPKQSHMIATHITSPLVTPLKLAFNVAFIGSFPFLLYQLWKFASPGLYLSEKKLMIPLISASILMMILGMLFCYFLILPLLFHFFTRSLPESIRLLPDIASYLDFVSHMLFIFGLCFQLPIICSLLVKIRLIDRDHLINARAYVIVGAFILGMLLTPPDVISQILLAIPIWGLYELGIILSPRQKKPIDNGSTTKNNIKQTSIE
jgi:sec-independent protein translocase protein TatC